ncbi:MAG: ATP-binding protein [Chthoniobacteraceae bacterium]
MHAVRHYAVTVLILVVVALLWLTWTIFTVPDWRLVSESLHSAVEAMGGLLAILMAMFLLHRSDEPYGGRLMMLALGFLAMGILDVSHSFPHPGQSFVFLHSAASLAGGVGFAFACLPEHALSKAIAWRWRTAWAVSIAAVFISIWALLPGAPIPLMVRKDEFTASAYGMNLAAGVCFLAAAVRLLADFRQTRRRNLFVLGGMAVLFGLANLMFSFSSLWDDTWWSWHLLRLGAFGIVFHEVVSEHRVTLVRLKEALREREHAEAALRHLNETLELRVQAQTAELKHSNDELAQFAYVASHDLQEPLRSVAGFLDLVINGKMDQLDEKGREYVAFARNAAERMRTLIQDLLSYSRISTQARTLAPCDMRAVLERVAGDLRFAIEESKAKVMWDSLPVVSGDAQQLGQLFQNLLSNALKFHGAEPPMIRISARQDGDAWQFSVADNGIGIEPRFAEQIFEVFHRLHSREQYAGSGIGLAICRKIVRRHGGRIWVESSRGNGATFHFLLPAVREVATDDKESDTVSRN